MSLPVVSAAQREQHERWLQEITALPTAAGREQFVIDWVCSWVKQRRNLRCDFDRAGNLLITRRRHTKSSTRTQPLFITAHLDHPAFVVREHAANENTIALEFRGGVHDPYFANAAIEIVDRRDPSKAHPARVASLDSAAKPFKRVTARLERPADHIAPGDIGRWRFEHDRGTLPRVDNDGLLHTHACDDLAAVAAALSALDMLRGRRGCEHVGVLLTRAEEIGFIGAIAACKYKSIPKSARLICLENSRSFPHDSPIGAGPIVRVGDKMSVFEPTLTNQISMLMMGHQKANPNFKYQRKLMPGGTCEATTFSSYGYKSTCLCLPLGNYHNMADIDEMLAGSAKQARVGPEFISVADYHGLIEMLLVCATKLDSAETSTLKGRMEGLIKEYGFVLEM
jgi:putative aminopeptidase FrvX